MFLWRKSWLLSTDSLEFDLQRQLSDKAQRKTASLEALVPSGSTCVHVLIDLIPVSNTFLLLQNHHPQYPSYLHLTCRSGSCTCWLNALDNSFQPAQAFPLRDQGLSGEDFFKTNSHSHVAQGHEHCLSEKIFIFSCSWPYKAFKLLHACLLSTITKILNLVRLIDKIMPNDHGQSFPN